MVNSTMKTKRLRKRPRGDDQAGVDWCDGWHPQWTTTATELVNIPREKRERLICMSELFQSLRGSVIDALEAREWKDQKWSTPNRSK